MNKYISHCYNVFVILGIVFSGYFFIDAIRRSSNEPIWVIAEHLSATSVVLLFSLAHGYLIVKGRVSWLSLVTYLPLYVLTGLLIAITVRSSYKHWAPATAGEAFWSNILWFSLCGGLVAVWALMLWLDNRRFKITRHNRKNDYNGINQRH